MKIQIPKVVLPVSLAEYAPELDGKFLFVWVNPPRNYLRAYDDLVTDLQEREVGKARIAISDQPSAVSGQKPTALQRVFDQVERMLKIKREDKSEGIDARLLEWYAQIWSQGPQDAQWTVDELRTLEEQEPSFLSWMIAQTWTKRGEHIERKKKVSATL